MYRAWALLSKEWAEARIFLVIGLGIFLGLPLASGLQEVAPGHPLRIFVWPLIYFLAGVLAIFVATGLTSRDLAERVEDFWRSRPIGITSLLLTKYAIGLAVVLSTCALPLAAEWKINGTLLIDSSIELSTQFSLWTAIFSLGFLCGCLTRRTAHAAMLALAAMLLLYCLPMVLPPLHWISLAAIDRIYSSRSSIARFDAGMLALSAVSLVAAIVAVQYSLRILANRKLMYGSIGAAMLILIASAAFQVGANLPVLDAAGLPEGEMVIDVSSDGHAGVVLSRIKDGSRCRLRLIEIADNHLRLMASVLLEDVAASGAHFHRVIWRPSEPKLAYVVCPHQESSIDLVVVDFDSGKTQAIPMPTFPKLRRDPGTEQILELITAFVSGNSLFVWGGGSVAMLDLSEPARPRLISTTQCSCQWVDNGNGMTIELPQIAGVSGRERLAATAGLRYGASLDGDALALFDYYNNDTRESSLAVMKLTALSPERAHFRFVGHYAFNDFEKFLGCGFSADASSAGGLLYEIPGGGYLRTIVFDIRRPRILRVGHFAAPSHEGHYGSLCVCPLPDGRAIIGGTKLYLVGPPAGLRER